MNLDATAFDTLAAELEQHSFKWLVTGAAGFIGSNLVEFLLKKNQQVVGMDNFSNGHRHNLTLVETAVGATAWQRFTFIEGDIRNLQDCHRACAGIDYTLHQAAIGSVPRSIADPIFTNENNISGFLNMLVASRDAGVKRFVYAASSSTYGDHPALPKREEQIGRPLSPYAVTKYVNELYAEVFARCYGMPSIGLRYFNVFGPRQDPKGAYAAVIPQWVDALIHDKPVRINGDGETSRDFCFIANVVQINMLAALTTEPAALNQIYNVALNDRTTLNGLYALMKELLASKHPHVLAHQPTYAEFRSGDVRHSQADISKAQQLLGYVPTHRLREGMQAAMAWYQTHLVA